MNGSSRSWRNPSFVAGLLQVLTVSTVLTAVMAWPVVRSPTRDIFGSEIVGRQHDAYTVMLQFAERGSAGVYTQPLTDGPGWALAHALPPVAAYNVLILATFPLAALAAYALSRYLFGSHAAAAWAGGAFAFAPAHLAQAAYHPHVAQVQWVPLYLLAIVAAVDRPNLWRLTGLVAAAAALVLSNSYGALIGLAVTVPALVGYWWTSPRANRRWDGLWRPIVSLLGLVGASCALAVLVAPRLVRAASAVVVPIADVGMYSARWWAYFVPPVDHVMFGTAASRAMASAGVTVGLVEQQLYLGWACVILAAIAVFSGVRRWQSAPRWRPLAAIGLAAIVAAASSLGPVEGLCRPDSWAAGCLLHRWLPMFRAYARVGIAVQLLVAVAGGAGVVVLWSQARLVSRTAAGLLLFLAAVEYWPLPARTHDVLPTEAHRWLATQPGNPLTLDCVPPDAVTATTSWLMHWRITAEATPNGSCDEPGLGARLAALGYTHVLVRHGRARPAAVDAPADFALVRDFRDSSVFAVIAPVPPVAVVGTEGFYDVEHSGDDWWRWMSPEGRWTIRMTGRQTRRVALDVTLQAFGVERDVRLTVDGTSVGVVRVGLAPERHTFGPWTLQPGLEHRFTWTALDPGTRPSDDGVSSDARLLTMAIRRPTWTTADGRHP